MAYKTKQELLDQNDAKIKINTNREITEQILHDHLEDIIDSTYTGDQTITLTSDITGSGTTSIETTISANVVSNDKLAQMPLYTIKGNDTGSTANAKDLTIQEVRTLLKPLGTKEVNESGLVDGSQLSYNLATDKYVIASILGKVATVGDGGTFTDIADAQTAGQYNLIAVGNITVSGNTTISNKISIDLCNYEINFGDYYYIISDTVGGLKIENGTIKYTSTTAKNVIRPIVSNLMTCVNEQLICNNITITNLSAVNTALFAGFGIYNDIIYNLPNKTAGAFGYNTGASIGFIGIVNRIKFNGGGVTCGGNTYVGIYRDVNIIGTYSNSNDFFFINATNITNNSTSNVAININTDITANNGYISNIIDFVGKLTMVIRDNGRLYSANCKTIVLGVYNTYTPIVLVDVRVTDAYTYTNASVLQRVVMDNCQFIGALTLASNNMVVTKLVAKSTFTLSGNNNEIDGIFTGNVTISGNNNVFKGQCAGTLTISGDRNTISDSSVTGDFTIAATADKTTVIGCRTTASIVDSGTNTFTSANHLI